MVFRNDGMELYHYLPVILGNEHQFQKTDKKKRKIRIDEYSFYCSLY
jgi:hypothetical protein